MEEETTLRGQLAATVYAWQENPPTRSEVLTCTETLMVWRTRTGADGLWEQPPKMVTATIDDAMGHGLDVIHRVAQMAGIELHPLGLLVPAEKVIAACRRLTPAWLGMTILQFDSEPIIAGIRAALPPSTRLIAGGPLFRADPELAARCGIDTVLADAAAFAAYLLDQRL